MQLTEIMNRYPVTVDVGTDIALARHMMAWSGVRHLPVLSGGDMVGILSERDLLRFVAETKTEGANASVEAAMTTDVQTASPSDSVTEAAARLSTSRIGCLPVTEKGKLVGLITTTDVLNAEVRQALAPHASGLTATDLMTASPVSAHPDDYLLDAAGRMQSNNVRHLPVVDGSDKVVGILSDRDVRAAIGDPTATYDDDRRVRLNSLRVADSMNRDPIAVGAGASLEQVAAVFVDHRLSAVPVIGDDNALIGIVSYIDILRAQRG